MTFKLLVRNKQVIMYGISMAVLLFLLKWLQVRFVIIDHAFEVYVGRYRHYFYGSGDLACP